MSIIWNFWSSRSKSDQNERRKELVGLRMCANILIVLQFSSLVFICLLLILCLVLYFKGPSSSNISPSEITSTYHYVLTSKDGKEHRGYITFPHQVTEPSIIYSGEDSEVFLLYKESSEEEILFTLTFDLRCCEVVEDDTTCTSVLKDVEFEVTCDKEGPECIKKGTKAMLRYMKMYSYVIFETDGICEKENEYYLERFISIERSRKVLIECTGKCNSNPWEYIEGRNDIDILEKEALEGMLLNYKKNGKKGKKPNEMDAKFYVRQQYEKEAGECEHTTIRHDFPPRYDRKEAWEMFEEEILPDECNYFFSMGSFEDKHMYSWDDGGREDICVPDLDSIDCRIMIPEVGRMKDYTEY